MRTLPNGLAGRRIQWHYTDVGDFQGTLGTFHRKHDPNPGALAAAYGGQYFGITGRGGGSFHRHAKALPARMHRAVAPLEGRPHDRVRGSGCLQAACHLCGPSAPSYFRRGAAPTPLDLFPAPGNNSSPTLPRRSNPPLPIPTFPRLSPSISQFSYSFSSARC